MDHTTEKHPNIRQAVPFFWVADMEKSLRFYTEGLGFKLVNEWIPRDKVEWCWLQRDAVAIMLQEPRDKGRLSPGLQGKGVSIYFQCGDALGLYREFVAKGIEIGEPFVGNHMWVVAFDDIDGYQLSFVSNTEVAEETGYSAWFK